MEEIKYIRVTDIAYKDWFVEIRENNEWKFLTDDLNEYADFLYDYISEEAYREELPVFMAGATCVVYRLRSRR